MLKDCTPSSLSTPLSGLALVAEGGGQRGAFTAGVLDSWLLTNFNPFKILIGTSAGAQNIASFLSGQLGYAYSLITDLTRTKPFFNPWRVFAKKSVMDLDWYFEQTTQPAYIFDEAKAQLNSNNRIVRFSASNKVNFQTHLIDPNEKGWMPSLKKSSAIPFLYQSQELVDGGVTAPIPVKQAYQFGAKQMVVIRTSEQVETPLTNSLKSLKPLLCRGKKCPQFLHMLETHESSYKEAQNFIQFPPFPASVVEISPVAPLKTKVLGSSKRDIVDDYKQGIRAGLKFIEQNAPQIRTPNIN